VSVTPAERFFDNGNVDEIKQSAFYKELWSWHEAILGSIRPILLHRAASPIIALRRRRPDENQDPHRHRGAVA
jgi:hypothetical protein